MSVITEVLILFTWGVTQFANQVKIRLTAQLIKVISRVFQNLLKYFNGTVPGLQVFFNLFILNDSDSAMKVLFNDGLSLQTWY